MDKFPMKLVIDAATTPLLHAKLSEARSPRERASLLRSIAEAALRIPLVEASTYAPRAQNVATTPPVTDASLSSGLPEQPVARADAHTIVSSDGAGGAFDSEDIADQLSAFF
jgi:hypothetical protein